MGLALGQSRAELSQCNAAYAVVPDAAVTWAQAKARCAARGAVLARINGITDLASLTGNAVGTKSFVLRLMDRHVYPVARNPLAERLKGAGA